MSAIISFRTQGGSLKCIHRSSGDSLKESLRQALREGGARPIEASDKLRKIQTENPQLIVGAFGLVFALLDPSPPPQQLAHWLAQAPTHRPQYNQAG